MPKSVARKSRLRKSRGRKSAVRNNNNNSVSRKRKSSRKKKKSSRKKRKSSKKKRKVKSGGGGGDEKLYFDFIQLKKDIKKKHKTINHLSQFQYDNRFKLMKPENIEVRKLVSALIQKLSAQSNNSLHSERHLEQTPPSQKQPPVLGNKYEEMLRDPLLTQDQIQEAFSANLITETQQDILEGNLAQGKVLVTASKE